ncbi:MAG: Cyclase family protein [Chloroflexi bacterium]|nr:Cyclase family protein [Chloroflexota bacterium]
MPVKLPKGWYDISVPLKQGMSYLILDPVPPKVYRLHDAELGSKVTISMLEILSHTCTHLDAPLHFIKGGSTISDLPLTVVVGPCRVIEIKDPKTIKIAELEKHRIKKGERLLFKTRNSPFTYAGERFVEDYVYLESDSAAYLAEKKIALFGLDNITIGDFRNEESIRKTHRALLEAGIYILEDCALGSVPPGEYELLCLPLLIYKGDAAPCRAILRPLK